MINRGKGMLITCGLIMKNKKIMGMSGKRDNGATWFKEKPEEKGTTLEKSGSEASRDQEGISVVPKRQT
jgi:hypothetical protein